ncbi:RagB/SusD family nutrient uptake outer membrane protein [Sphingobacterium sp. KU25419]|nr:RagB/SusD family nutrient uptake outer membrane protein [Sphingobacterium sp. KU25419]
MKITKYFTLIFLAWLMSCSKLDIKPDLSRVVPSTLEDFQGILDNTLTVFNISFNNYGEIAANDFYVTDDDFQANYTPATSNIYLWETSELDDPYIFDWNTSYSRILHCNIVLDGLDKNNIDDEDMNFQNVKGQALFHRAHSFYMLAEEFAPAYDSQNLKKLAIPLRTTSDINLSYPLSSVEDTYQLIIDDVKEAANLLPRAQLFQTRPSKTAAFALLARIYLVMGDYENALIYADLSLEIQSDLLDYNQLDINADCHLHN